VVKYLLSYVERTSVEYGLAVQEFMPFPLLNGQVWLLFTHEGPKDAN
jgi:hypothetical protein